MTARTALMVFFIICTVIQAPASDEISSTIDHAKEYLLKQNYQETAQLLSRALQLVNQKMLDQLKSSLPAALKGWRSDEAVCTVGGTSPMVNLNVKQSYFQEGGGSSVDIKMETNSIRIGNIKMLLLSPSKLNRVDDKMKINTIADRQCLEKYDPIDRYAELIFVPTSSLMITIIGQDMKNTKIITEYAEKINWADLETMFP